MTILIMVLLVVLIIIMIRRTTGRTITTLLAITVIMTRVEIIMIKNITIVAIDINFLSFFYYIIASTFPLYHFYS